MKEESYSTYEAKARLSEILRKVRENKRVVITHRGDPVAVIGPVPPSAKTLEGRLEELVQKGILVRGKKLELEAIAPVVHRPGTLERFLADRE